MDRRASLLTSAFVAVALAAGGLAAVTSKAEAAGEVSLLTWEGYADESFVKDFEAESGCKLTATYVGSNDDYAPKLAAGGGVYDLISPSIDTTSVMVKAGLVEPIDPAKVERLDEVFPQFRDAAGKLSDAERGPRLESDTVRLERELARRFPNRAPKEPS